MLSPRSPRIATVSILLLLGACPGDGGDGSGTDPGTTGASTGSSGDTGSGTSGEDPTETGTPSMGVVQLAASDHTCAVTIDGTVRCWGYNWAGQLGYAHTMDIGDDETPASAGDVDVGGPVSRIAPAYNHTCALLLDGTVRCWGRNQYAALGDPTTNGQNIGDDETPASRPPIDIGGTVVELASGNDFNCVRLAAGGVKCWGSAMASTPGQLGYGDTNNIGDDETPAAVGTVDIGGEAIALARSNGHNGHMCAILQGGALRCWGASGSPGFGNPLGHGNTNTIGDDETPASAGDVPVGGPVTRVAVGQGATCAVLAGGGLRCWGNGEAGRLGYGNTESIGDDETPESVGDVPVGGPVVDVAVGDFSTCVLLEGGAVRCWGDAGKGRLGYGSAKDIGDDETPESVGDVPLGGVAVAVTVGVGQACALLEHGGVRCWGSGGGGKLGYGNIEDVGDDETPVSVGDVPVL